MPVSVTLVEPFTLPVNVTVGATVSLFMVLASDQSPLFPALSTALILIFVIPSVFTTYPDVISVI